MIRHVSAREARSQFAELTDRVRYTGEPVIVEKMGKPYVALVSLEDLEHVRRLRGLEAADRFTARAFRSAMESGEPELTEEEIVEAVRRTREAIYRERYGTGTAPRSTGR